MPSRIEVRQQVQTCTACPLHAEHHGPVPFRGPYLPKVAVVGEAPGSTEDEKRIPFCGPAGKRAQDWLIDAGLNVVTDVALLNLVSCFPSKDGKARPPTNAEVTACQPNLEAQLAFLAPQFVLILGQAALQGIYQPLFNKAHTPRTANYRSRFFRLPYHTPGYPYVFCTWHPARGLRDPAIDKEARADVAAFWDMASQGLAHRNLYCVECNHEATYWRCAIPFCSKHWEGISDYRKESLRGSGRGLGED